MIETLSVVAIVSVAVVLAGRSFYRTLKGGNDGCGGCGGECSGCGSQQSAGARREQGTNK
jgi:hypothetical protein